MEGGVWGRVRGRGQRERQREVPPTCFSPPQGERGVKGACGLDGEKGDKVQRGGGVGGGRA